MPYNVLWSGTVLEKMYLQSGDFTSIVKDSQDVSSIDTSIRGINWDGINVAICGRQYDKIYLTSGKFTSVVKDSLAVQSVDDAPQGISSDHIWNTPWAGAADSKLYLTSGQFTSVYKDSEDVSSIDTTPTAICFDGTDIMWCGQDADKLYLQSGEFTSVLKTSLDISILIGEPTCISWDGTDTLTNRHGTYDILYRLSGKFTSVVKDSEDVTLTDGGLSDACTENVGGRLELVPTPPTGLSVIAEDDKAIISWNKFETEQFDNLDRWTFENNGVGETATIVSSKLRLDIPDGVDGYCLLEALSDQLPENSFDIQIDIVNYVADDPGGDGINAYLQLRSSDLSTHRLYIYYSHRTLGHYTRGYHSINGGAGVYSDIVYLSSTPTKFRIVRNNNILTCYAYDGEWIFIHSVDFGNYANDLKILIPSVVDNNTRGGYVDFDNLIDLCINNLYWSKSPGVTKENGNKISDITNPYNHLDLDPTTYYYILTIDNIYGESNESSEESVSIEVPSDIPIITGLSGDSENILSISEIEYATLYNIYWSLNSNITKENGTKISNSTLQYNHIDLIKQNYYYVATSENQYGESDISNEICIKPDFEGKIFNHTERIKNSLLYQYKDKD